jgi:hypothetical protein
MTCLKKQLKTFLRSTKRRQRSNFLVKVSTAHVESENEN